MKRDILIQVLVGVEAELRRIERLSASIGDAAEHKKRIPPLIAASRYRLQSTCSRIEQSEERIRP